MLGEHKVPLNGKISTYREFRVLLPAAAFEMVRQNRQAATVPQGAGIGCQRELRVQVRAEHARPRWFRLPRGTRPR